MVEHNERVYTLIADMHDINPFPPKIVNPPELSPNVSATQRLRRRLLSDESDFSLVMDMMPMHLYRCPLLEPP